jgi:hypothetical protein
MSQNGTDGARENEKQIGARIAIWQQLITDPALSWVLFKNGTVVVLEDPSEDDLAQQAISVLNRWGRQPSGVPSGDFTVIAADAVSGWVVTSHFVPGFDLLIYVGSEELAEDNPSADAIGCLGCEKREQDTTLLAIVHIEDRRTSQA